MSTAGATTDAHHGEQRRQVDHDGQREQHQQDVAAHDREEAEQPLDQRRVRVGPGHQLTGRHPVEVVEVQRLQVVVHGVAQVVLDGEGHPAAPVAADVGEAEAGRRESPTRSDQPRPQRRGVRGRSRRRRSGARPAGRSSGRHCRAPRPRRPAPRPGDAQHHDPRGAAPNPAVIRARPTTVRSRRLARQQKVSHGNYMLGPAPLATRPGRGDERRQRPGPGRDYPSWQRCD